MKQALIIFLIFFLSACLNSAPQDMIEEKAKTIRYAYVSGDFYPLAPDLLSSRINGLLRSAGNKEFPAGSGVRALIAPHAGYDYSGQVAAHAYNAVEGVSYARVILLSNSHSLDFPGIAIDDNDAWQTPLGEVSTDRELMDKMVQEEYIDYNSSAHEQDHTLEVQIPWLQSVLEPGFKIVPLMFGRFSQKDQENFVRLLSSELKDGDLLVISTDLSHYPPYAAARELDKATLGYIERLDLAGLNQHVFAKEEAGEAETLCCGIDAVNALVSVASIKGWQADLLDYANSGDAENGRKERVVGYGALVFSKPAGPEAETVGNSPLDREQKQKLLSIAKNTVEEYAKSKTIPDFSVKDSSLKALKGAFVTLRKNGRLRGCIGQIIPEGLPLWQVVRDMAIGAAFEDPRFPPISAGELPDLEYEISVLSVPEEIGDWQSIILGKHGVIVEKGFFKGVFLPQVAEEAGWDRETLLGELCESKAGLPRDAYKNDPDTVLKVFTAEVFS